MSDESAVVRIAVPKVLYGFASSLAKVKVGDTVVQLHNETSIVREALARGLRLMMIERKELDMLATRDAKKGAKKIYTSLVKTAESASESASVLRSACAINGVGNMEEEKPAEESTEEEETTEQEEE